MALSGWIFIQDQPNKKTHTSSFLAIHCSMQNRKIFLISTLQSLILKPFKEKLKSNYLNFKNYFQKADLSDKVGPLLKFPKMFLNSFLFWKLFGTSINNNKSSKCWHVYEPKSEWEAQVAWNAKPQEHFGRFCGAHWSLAKISRRFRFRVIILVTSWLKPIWEDAVDLLFVWHELEVYKTALCRHAILNFNYHDFLWTGA